MWITSSETLQFLENTLIGLKMAPPLVSIVIVNYNAGAYLAACLDSLAVQTLADFEVIVVDNASRDDSLSAVQGRARVRVMRNSSNLGFAAAQNQGMRASQGRYLMALNFDIQLAPDYLAQAVAAMESYPMIGSLSGKMLKMKPDGERTTQFDNAGLLFTRRRMPQHRGVGEQDRGQYQQPDLVFGVMGAAALYRRAMLDDVAWRGQYFDESYFMWYEDIDLDWRARLRGWDCLYLPQAVAYHVGDPHGHGRSRFGAEMTIRNRWMMILANENMLWAVRNSPWLVYEEFNLLSHVLRSGLAGAYLRALGGFIQRIPPVLKKRRWSRSRVVRAYLPEYPCPLRLS
jgi:GT2 family glycosyltransferase